MTDGVDKKDNSGMYQLQVLQQQLYHVEQQKNQMQQRLMELDVTISTIDGLKEDGKDVIFPIGGGLFFEGCRNDTDSVLVPVGAGVLVRKNLEEAEKFTDQMKADVLSSIEQIDKQIAKMTEAYDKLLKDVS